MMMIKREKYFEQVIYDGLRQYGAKRFQRDH